MPKSILVWVLCVVAADIVVTTFVALRYVAKRRSAQGGSPAGSGAPPDLRVLSKFSEAMQPRIAEIVRANWNGDPDGLAPALSMAIEACEREARGQGLALDHDVFRKLIEMSVERNGIARGTTLREALKRAA